MKLGRLTPLLALLSFAALGRAVTTTYRVTQSVGSLFGTQPEVSDPYLFLDFQLTDGSQTSNGNSSVDISNLGLTGGAFDFTDTTLPDIGNVSGSGNAFTLRDGPASFGSLADHAVLFRVTSADAVLTYDFTVTTATASDLPSPDGFNVAMLYRTGTKPTDVNVVVSSGPTGNETVNYVFDGSPTARPAAFGVDPLFAATRKAVGDTRFSGLGLPVITTVPEPSALAALGLGAIALLRRRKR